MGFLNLTGFLSIDKAVKLVRAEAEDIDGFLILAILNVCGYLL